MGALSLLDITNICDNARPRRQSPIQSAFDHELLVSWHLSPAVDSPAIGLLRPQIVKQLHEENDRSSRLSLQPAWHFIEGNKPRISFQEWADTPQKRSQIMAELCERWRDDELFPDVCGPTKWRNELYPIYRRPFGPRDHLSSNTTASADSDDLNYAFEMERSACALFGVVTYGVHMSIYSAVQGNVHIWVSTRAKAKPTWPGYLDNSVAGGIPSGMTVIDSILKEAMEEASIPEDITQKYARSVGAISYFIRTPTGWLQPEIEYVYDMVIPEDLNVQPKPNDGEVECFEYLHQDEVMQRMRKGLFKPNCALVILDLLIRLGYITPDNEPDFMEIITRLHGRFDYEDW